ncbi:GNAT family N-acetyltransferase [Streptomyces canus]|uniref:GNAT family N-acetyltransferase n=1 Tax=Streptomyces canus TaxID=58343 RepID=UPI0038B593C4
MLADDLVQNRDVDDHQGVDFFAKPTLTGELVMLRPLDLEQDALAIRDWLTDPEVARFTAGIPGTTPAAPWDEAAELRMREWYGSREHQSDRLDLAVSTGRAAIVSARSCSTSGVRPTGAATSGSP